MRMNKVLDAAPKPPNAAQMRHYLAILDREKARRTSHKALASFAPYPRQRAFIDATRTHREALFVAGNQLGKSLVGAAIMAASALGLPDLWPEESAESLGKSMAYPSGGGGAGGRGEGVRGSNPVVAHGPEDPSPTTLENGDTAKDSFDTSRAESNNLSSATEKSRFSVTYWDRPIVAWAAGVTAVGCRDTVQRLLLGRPGALGTGMIPKEAILDTVSSRGVPDLFDHVKVRHSSGGVSLIYFKSYEQGREKWQGETVDIIWFDEEPPLDIYIEGLTRTNATGGHVFVTFTPLMGMSDVVARFLMEKSPDRSVTQMTIDDVLHYTQEQKQRIIESYPIHEREARTKGVPIMGSGRVFPVSEEQITTDPFEIPEYWAKLGGMDFGWDHPFAAIEMVHDREEDVVYVTKCFRAKEQTPVLHASALRHWGPIPWAWPHDGYQHDKGSGKSLADQYRSEGLDMYHENARFPDGGFGVEAGISLMLTRMQTGRFKVFKHLNEWFEEFRLYHRKDGMIVKERDDLMAATRYALMMLRIATAVQELPRQEKYLSKTIKRLGTWMSR